MSMQETAFRYSLVYDTLLHVVSVYDYLSTALLQETIFEVPLYFAADISLA